MSDYICHVKQTTPAFEETYWCGRKVTPEFAFINLEHAVYNNMQGGRLLPCKRCVKRVVRLLQSEE